MGLLNLIFFSKLPSCRGAEIGKPGKNLGLPKSDIQVGSLVIKKTNNLWVCLEKVHSWAPVIPNWVVQIFFLRALCI